MKNINELKYKRLSDNDQICMKYMHFNIDGATIKHYKELSIIDAYIITNGYNIIITKTINHFLCTFYNTVYNSNRYFITINDNNISLRFREDDMNIIFKAVDDVENKYITILDFIQHNTQN